MRVGIGSSSSTSTGGLGRPTTDSDSPPRDGARAARRRIAVALAMALVPTLLTACTAQPEPDGTRTVTATQQSGTSTSTAPPTPTASTADSGSAAGSASASSAATTRTDPDAPKGQCSDATLAVSVQHDPEGDGAGQRGAFVVFRNTGPTSCHLEGTPGLSLVGGGDGTQIGRPATRTTRGAVDVSIGAGGYALAAVTYTDVDSRGGNFNDGKGGQVACDSKRADGYRVYPPHSYRAYFTRATTYACSTGVHWIGVAPVKPAAEFSYFTPTS